MKITSLLRIGKLLSFLSLGGALREVRVIRNVVTQIAVVFALTLASAIMVGASFLFALYGIYRALMHYGIESDYAILYTGIFTVLMAAILIGFTIKSVKKMVKLTKKLQQTGSPVVNKVKNVANSFVDGLMTQSNKVKEAQYDEKRKYYS